MGKNNNNKTKTTTTTTKKKHILAKFCACKHCLYFPYSNSDENDTFILIKYELKSIVPQDKKLPVKIYRLFTHGET